MRAAERYRRFHFSVQGLAKVAIAENRDLLDALRRHDAEEVERLTRGQGQRAINSLERLVAGDTESE